MNFITNSVFSSLLAVSMMTSVAEAINLTGKTKAFFIEHEGTLDSIQVDINGELFDTGPITFSLDLTSPENSFEIFDFDTLTVIEKSDFLVTTPLFGTLGIEPVRVQVVETGTFEVLSPINPQLGGQNFEIITDLTGTVIVPDGSVFAGYKWTNKKRQRVGGYARVNGDGKVEGGVCWTKEIAGRGRIESPPSPTTTGIAQAGGIVQERDFLGSGLLAGEDVRETCRVPEPTSTLSLLALGTLGAASTLKRKLKPCQFIEKETTKVG
jgi:hypothetical protein